jgi:hypothetical protein
MGKGEKGYRGEEWSFGKKIIILIIFYYFFFEF